MGIKPGFYQAWNEYNNGLGTVLVFGDYDKDGKFVLKDEYGRKYDMKSLGDNVKPMCEEDVMAYVAAERGRIRFVDKGLEKLAKG
ncbi:MAG: hypothetical protein WC548_03370 [Candidatus Pacearchaeota archaeon]